MIDNVWEKPYVLILANRVTNLRKVFLDISHIGGMRPFRRLSCLRRHDLIRKRIFVAVLTTSFSTFFYDR